MKKEFRDIKEYMKLSREERRSHLDLSEGCIEIGGDSRLFRGLLAHFLKTTIGSRNIHVCHACNNSGCSNPVHLYWGTPKDNWQDAKESGRWEPIHSRMLKKHGEEKVSEILSNAASKAGKVGGGWNALTAEQLLAWKQAIKEVDLDRLGWIAKLSSSMHCSHTHARRIMERYFPEFKTFRRNQHKKTD